MNDLISIIIPVYNAERYLEECVCSCLAQSHKNIEIILVDDGSSDSSPAICDDFAIKDSRVKVIHQVNSGQHIARIAGFKICQGDYVAFVDADDIVAPNMFEYLLKLLKDNDADISKIQLVTFENNIDQIQKTTEKINIYNREEYAKRFFKIGYQGIEYYVHSKLYKTSLIDPDFHPKNYRIGEDVIDTYKILLKADRIVESNQSMYYYRTDSGITSSFSNKYFLLIDVWDDIYDIASEEAPDHLEYVKINQARIRFTILTELALSGSANAPEYKEQRENLLKELKQNKSMLLASNISKSRKFLIRWYCIDYTSASFFVYKLRTWMSR